MQKISTYLYPNRIQLLADLAGFPTEYTNVYQRTVKIYNGIDNAIEFDIKNADQKRVDLSTLTDIQLNVMDASGFALPNSPYEVLPMDQLTLKGLASATIPKEDLAILASQYLTFSVTATKGTAQVILYGDSRFGATGTMELVGSAMPVTRDDRVYTSFTAEIDLKGVPTWHSSAIPSTFYEAVPTQELNFSVSIKGLTGSIWIEATKSSTISVESFKQSTYLASSTVQNFTGNWEPDALPIGEYKYFRVSYSTPHANGIGASFDVTRTGGNYHVALKSGGTGYAIGSQMKVLGSLLGGVDGINDLIISVTQTDSASTGYISSYAVSSIIAVTWTGTAEAGDAEYIVTGTNITGTVDKVTVS